MSESAKVVVIGAGISGLAAAAALSPYCSNVTIIEKADSASENEVRRHVPQGSHIHILLQAGLNSLDELLPGFSEILIREGSAVINGGEGLQIYQFGSWTPLQRLPLEFLGQSRPFLEKILRDCIKQKNNILFIRGAVNNIVVDSSGKVTHLITNENEPPLTADIVVDATGASAKLFSQFKIEVPVNRLKINIFYSTLHFNKPSDYIKHKENILIVPEPGTSNLGGSLIDIENNQWCISLHGRDKCPIPGDVSEWKELAHQLPDQRIWQRIESLDPIAPLKTFKKAESVWRRFDLVSELPEGYLPIGDLINSLNPIYGQGMTIALGHALALRDLVRMNRKISVDKKFQEEYFSAALTWTQKAWKKAEEFEKNFSLNDEKQLKRLEMLKKIVAATNKRAEIDKQVHLKIVKEAQMLK